MKILDLFYLLHVVPVGDDSVLNRVLEGQDTTLALGFVSDVGVLLAHADHDTLVAGTADDGGEDSAGSVVSGETGLAHTGAIVYDKSGNVVVTHFGWFVRARRAKKRKKMRTVQQQRGSEELVFGREEIILSSKASRL